MAPHCEPEGHVGSCGGRGVWAVESDEALTWIGEMFGNGGMAGKARVPGNEDESAMASTASRKQDVPTFVLITGNTPVNVFTRSTVNSMIGDNTRNVFFEMQVEASVYSAHAEVV